MQIIGIAIRDRQAQISRTALLIDTDDRIPRKTDRYDACRTKLSNQIRGLLAEYGIVIPIHLSRLRQALPAVIEEASSLLTGFGRQLADSLYEEIYALEVRVTALEKHLERIFQESDTYAAGI